MPKSKTKPQAKPARADVVDATLIALTNRVDALDEAICPKVAARLTALERRAEADDADKKKAFEVLNALRTIIVTRVGNLERVIQAIQRAPEVKDTQEIRSAFGADEIKGQTTAPSKADDRGIVSYMITKLKKEMGIEFTEAGMKRIITLIEKV